MMVLLKYARIVRKSIKMLKISIGHAEHTHINIRERCGGVAVSHQKRHLVVNLLNISN